MKTMPSTSKLIFIWLVSSWVVACAANAPTDQALEGYIVDTADQLSGKKGEMPNLEYDRVSKITFVNPPNKTQNPYFDVSEGELKKAIADILQDPETDGLRKDLVDNIDQIEITNKNGTFTFKISEDFE